MTVVAVLWLVMVGESVHVLWRERRDAEARRVDDWLTYTRTPRQ